MALQSTPNTCMSAFYSPFFQIFVHCTAAVQNKVELASLKCCDTSLCVNWFGRVFCCIFFLTTSYLLATFGPVFFAVKRVTPLISVSPTVTFQTKYNRNELKSRNESWTSAHCFFLICFFIMVFAQKYISMAGKNELRWTYVDK